MIQSVLKMVLRRQLICKASLNKQMALGNVGKSYVKLHWFTEFSQKIVEETPKVWNWHSGRSRNGQFLCSNFVCCANALVCRTFSPALVARAPGTGSALALLLSQEKRVTEVWNEFRWYQYIFISTYMCLGHQRDYCDYKELQGSIRFYDTMSCACTSPNSHFPCVAEKYSTLSPLL